MRQIYHATCHADAVKSGTLVEADTEMPDVDQSLKRKAKEENSEVRPTIATESDCSTDIHVYTFSHPKYLASSRLATKF